MFYNLDQLLALLQFQKEGRKNIRICDIPNQKTLDENFVIRCDVERSVPHTLSFAKSLKSLNLYASFYFHTRKNVFNPQIMIDIQNMGHEVGLHYECLDRCQGNFELARELFLKEVDLFRKNHIHIKTVCMHGEGGITKKGYTRNSDLLRHFPSLIQEADLVGEAYFLIKPPIVYASDTFRSYSTFFKYLSNAPKDTFLHVLLHPHRWHHHFLQSFPEVLKDILQAGKNRLLKKRTYHTVWDAQP